jgi:hypothetical protein
MKQDASVRRSITELLVGLAPIRAGPVDNRRVTGILDASDGTVA